jgi:hypothetical protein
VTGGDPLRSADGRFRALTAVERFARLAPVQDGAAGDLAWLDAALAPARRRARAVDGPATDPAPPAPVPEPAPPPGPSPAPGRVPAGPMGSSPAGDLDLIRQALRGRLSRHNPLF